MNRTNLFESAELFIWESIIKISADVAKQDENSGLYFVDTTQDNKGHRIIIHIIITAIFAFVLGIASGYFVANNY